MKLIIIVFAFLVEQHLGPLERLRDWKWLQFWADKLHVLFGARQFWAGPIGVLATLAPPLLLAKLVISWFHTHFGLVWLVLQVVALLYAMGPQDLFNLIDKHLRALTSGNTEEIEASSHTLTGVAGLTPEQRPQAVLEAMFIGTQQRLFAVYFWFVLLGGVGALLVRGLAELKPASTARALGFSHAADRLHALIMWIPARLFALGFALAGSLTHTFDRWSFQQTTHADENDNLLKAAGLGALQFDRGGQALPLEEEHDWVEQARGLVGRAFLVWLTVLGLMTLFEWLV